MESAEKVPNQHFAVSLLGLPAEDDVFAEDEDSNEILIKPKSSPLPRRRSSSSDEGSEPPLTPNRKVSFADAFGLELVSVREYDKWDMLTGGALGSEPQGERPLLEECLLLPLFELPSTHEDLMQKLYAQKVELESTEFPPGTTCMKGVIRALNISYEKLVYIRMTLNNWSSYYDILADYVADSCDGETDQFRFKISLVPPYLKNGAKVEFAIRYETPGAVYWANNQHKNYVISCHKKDDPNASDKSLEELDDRNLKSCLKTSSSKEILETFSDDGSTMLPHSEDTDQQATREAILETNTFSQWNTKNLFDKNTGERSKQESDMQINPPWRISLATTRDQETNLTLIEGSDYQVKEENEKNATAASESPISQLNDTEVEHNKFASVNNYAENEVKQEQETMWVEFLLDSNKNTSNLSTQIHEGSINTTVQTDSANDVASNDNIMTQSSHLFWDEAHILHEGSLLLSQERGETVASHVIDTPAKLELEWDSFSGSNTDSLIANDMQDNLVIVQDAIDKCDKLPNNTQNPIKFLQETAKAASGSGECAYLTGNTLTNNESESIAGSAARTNADVEVQSDRGNSSVHSPTSSKQGKVSDANISDAQEPLKYYSKAENLEGLKQENDFSEKPNLTKKEQSAIKRAPKVSSKERFSDHSEIGEEVDITLQAKEETSCDTYSNNRRIATDTTGVIEFTHYINMHSALDKADYHNLGKEFGTCPQTTSSEQLEVTNMPNIETTAMTTEMPVLQGSLEEKYQDPCEMNKTLTQIPEIHFTNKDIANEQNGNEVAATQISGQPISAPPCVLADTVVKEAIEAALFEITRDEGRPTTSISRKGKSMQRLPSGEQFSKPIQKGTTAFHLTSKHERPLKIHINHEQNAKGDYVPEANVAMGQDVSDTPQRNREEGASMIDLHAKKSASISEDIKHPGAPCSSGQSLEVAQNLTDLQLVVENQSEARITADMREDVANSMKKISDRQEAAEGNLSCEIADTDESIPENILESVELKITENGEVKEPQSEIAKQWAINLTQLPAEKAHYSENERDVDFAQSSNVSEMDLKQNYSVPDVDEFIEMGKVELEGEEALSTKNILQHYGGTDESRSMGFSQLHKVTGTSQTIQEVLSAPEQIAEEDADYETSRGYEAVHMQECRNENGMDGDRERADIFSQPIGAQSLKMAEMCHDAQQGQINESTNQNAVRPKNITKISSTPYTSREKQCRITTLPQNSESCSRDKHLGPAILISTPIEEDEKRETSSNVSCNMHPYSEGLESGECNEKILENEQASEACDSNVKSEESWSQGEPFADEITLKNTVWKVCCFISFIVFLVTVYHYDFIGCFALYLISLYWLYCEGETNTDSVKKE
ncbi:uncharacterized protein ppp1r3ab isoform X1 [Mustelus asterias]